MNWITWAIGAGNATLLEIFQHKIVTMHQYLTNQNTNLLNFLEQANANQSCQLLNLQKKMDITDKATIQMAADLYKKATSNQ
jgi:ACT domain-containing protein